MQTITKSIKTKLFTVSLGFGNSAWVERSSYGVIYAKADFHPDDPIFVMAVGSPADCYRAVMSVYRARRNNFRGKVTFPKSSTRI